MKKVKVSQATIDSMKTMGMTAAIKKAASGNASAEFVEGARRMYSQRRIDEAKPKPSPSLASNMKSTRDMGTGARKPRPELGSATTMSKDSKGKVTTTRKPPSPTRADGVIKEATTNKKLPGRPKRSGRAI